MKKIMIGAIGLLIVVNIALFGIIYKSISNEETEQATPSMDELSAEEAVFFIEETLPYYEDLTLELWSIWENFWVDTLAEFSEGTLPTELMKLPMSTLKISLESVERKADSIPVSGLNEAVAEEVLASISLLKISVSNRLDAVNMVILGVHQNDISDDKMQEIMDAVDSGDTHLKLSQERMNGLVAQLNLEREEQTNEGNVEAEVSAPVTDNAISSFLRTLLDREIGEIEKLVSEATNVRMAYADGNISIDEAVRSIDDVCHDLYIYMGELQMPHPTTAEEQQLYDEFYADFESVKEAYYNHAFAQKTLALAIASERDEIGYNAEGYTPADYIQFGEEAQRIVDEAVDETLAFYEKVSMYVE